jgi:hypothetical protein
MVWHGHVWPSNIDGHVCVHDQNSPHMEAVVLQSIDEVRVEDVAELPVGAVRRCNRPGTHQHRLWHRTYFVPDALIGMKKG